MPNESKTTALIGSYMRKTTLQAAAFVACLGMTSVAVAADHEEAGLNGLTDGAVSTSTEDRSTSSLVARLAERERLGATERLVRTEYYASGTDLLSPATSSNRTEATSSERPLMGTIPVPMVGRVSVVSQEFDEYGEVEGVNFFSIDRPSSKWDVDVDVDDGAKFEFTRKWGGSGKQPFKLRDKQKATFPGL